MDKAKELERIIDSIGNAVAALAYHAEHGSPTEAAAATSGCTAITFAARGLLDAARRNPYFLAQPNFDDVMGKLEREMEAAFRGLTVEEFDKIEKARN